MNLRDCAHGIYFDVPFLQIQIHSSKALTVYMILNCCKGKGKVVPVLSLSPTPWRRIGEWRYSSTNYLTSALDGGEWSASRPGRFTPRERAPGTHWIGGWVGFRAVLDAVVKRKIPSSRRESNPRTPIFQPVAQRYTDWAITALYHFYLYTGKKWNFRQKDRFVTKTDSHVTLE
jgi:hypothetical protein